MTNRFISPTMDWIYAKDRNWASDTETLYKLGFSKRTMVDVHGYDIRGFNADGVDRLGCTEQDYKNPQILAIGKTSGEYMSLSQKLPIALPRFLKLKATFEQICRDRWDVEQDWVTGIEELKQDGRIRLYTNLGTDFSIGLHWFDQADQESNFFTIRTDVVAKLLANGSDGELCFRIASRSLGSDYELAETNVRAVDLVEASKSLTNHVGRYLQLTHNWHIHIVDTPDGPALAAYSASELREAGGDRFGQPVAARTREGALQVIMDNAKTSSVAAMASAGINTLIGHPAVVFTPKIAGSRGPAV
jgi:hypothetical protein